MTDGAENDHFLDDFATFLRALLPQAQGFICHDRRGRVFWSEAPPDGLPAITDAYRATLASLLRGRPMAADGAKLTLGSNVAYVVRLERDGKRPLGALTVLVERSAAIMPYKFVVDVLGPALRSLQRELFLRFQVVDGQRKLQVQAAEERLLHEIEKILHERQPCHAALELIVSLCQKNLGVAGVWLVIPDKQIALVCGDTVTRAEAELRCQALVNEARSPAFDANAVSQSKELLWMPVHARGQGVQGIFALNGWERSEFSQRRLARVARYVGSHIDSVLDRDFDALTGLMAWHVFEREFADSLRESDAGAHSIMCLDVDQLHVVNDTFGREVGDEVLRRFAAQLRDMLPGQPVSRVSGDNFAALLRHKSTGEARRLGDDICTRFRENVYVRGDQTHRPSVSIGISPLAGDGGDSGGGLATAQVACQAAKDRGRGRVEVYESGDASIIRRVDDIQLVGYVRNAIENGRLALMGQRIMPLKAGRVPHYYEVLVRIVDDDGQHVLPADFISSAERYGLMEDLDRWVVASTLNLVAGAGKKLRGGAARFAINLSGQSLGSDSFLSFVEGEITAQRACCRSSLPSRSPSRWRWRECSRPRPSCMR